MMDFLNFAPSLNLIKKFIMELLKSQRVRRFVKETFFLALIVAGVVFAWVRTLFFELPFSLREDSIVLFKTIFTAWIIVAGFKAGWHLMLFAGERMRTRIIQKRVLAGKWTLVLLFPLVLAACHVQSSGFHTDAGTGLTTHYSGVSMSEARIVMNGETLNHTDIPLGERFTIINDGVKGLTVRDSKVSVGCSLVITDTTGRELFAEKDLFAKNGVFDENKITYLQCQVNTGAPMEWLNEYNVRITFWDKYGDGKIENSVKVNMIDEP